MPARTLRITDVSRSVLPDKHLRGERNQIATDPGKAGPIGFHRRHRPAEHGGLIRTGPLGSRSAASIRMDAGWQAESGLRFLLELQVQRRQRRPEAEGPWREQHVLPAG